MTRSDFLEFEVEPERCLKNENVEFHIGTPINQVLTMLQQNARILHNIDLMYSKKEPFNRDICVHLSNGIKLIFDARSQLLKIIEVDNLSKIILKYCDKVFSEPGAEATMDRVGESFGCTLPGEYDESAGVYVQSWRGLAFCFPTNNSSHVEVAPGFGPNLRSLKYDSDSAPRLTKMTLFKGSSLASKSNEPLEVPMIAYCGQSRLLLAESLNDCGRITGMTFTFLTQDKNSNGGRANSQDFELVRCRRVVSFGDHATEVMATLGAPSKVFYKSDDKMSIHKDVLFDFTTKKVIKFVLHTNVPGHYDFGMYNRCDFQVTLPSSDGDETVIHTTDKYDSFSHVVLSQQPVVLNRNTPEERNPFGATFAYGTRQVVIEVMDNFHIAGLTLFDSA